MTELGEERRGCFRWLRSMAKSAEAAEIRRFGRSIALVLRTPVLVLETTGRRSGARRETALASGQRLMLVGHALVLIDIERHLEDLHGVLIVEREPVAPRPRGQSDAVKHLPEQNPCPPEGNG